MQNNRQNSLYFIDFALVIYIVFNSNKISHEKQ